MVPAVWAGGLPGIFPQPLAGPRRHSGFPDAVPGLLWTAVRGAISRRPAVPRHSQHAGEQPGDQRVAGGNHHCPAVYKIFAFLGPPHSLFDVHPARAILLHHEDRVTIRP